MNIEVSWPCCYFLKNLFQLTHCNSSSFSFRINRSNLSKPMILLLKFIIFIIDNFLIIFLIFLQMSISFILYLLFSKITFFDHKSWILLIHCRFIFNNIIHLRLCEKWLILLIMPISSKTNHINEDIFFKFKSVLYCYFHTFIQDSRWMGVDMEYWSSYNFSNLCTVITWSSLFRICCKSYLIVHDYMDNSSWCVIF